MFVHTSSLLERRLCELLASPAYRPLRQHELASALHLHRDDKQSLRRILRDLERQGRLICLRKNRWALPSPFHQTKSILRGLPSGDALALPEEPAGDAFYISRDALAGSIDGDQVLVEPLRKRPHTGETTGRAPARVIRVLPRNGRLLAGTLLKGRGYWYVIPDNSRVTTNVNVIGTPANWETLPEHHRIVVALDDWKGPGSALTGNAVEDLGPADAAGVRLLSLMRNHGLDSRFEKGVDHEARERKPELTDNDLLGREDLRSWITFTIDPSDARDFDDAVSLRRRDDGRWEAGIHIADVAHFVPRDSEVDREARRRGNSVYLTGGFVPMLPPYLTSDICSLRPNQDRLTHSVLLVLDADGTVLEKKTTRSVIHSVARLDYDQVQQFIDHGEEPSIPDRVKQVLVDMIPVARAIRQKRMRMGSIDLAMPEVKCELNENGCATAFHRRGAPEAYHLIEEFMLLANVAVSEIISTRRVPAIYRIHEEPNEDQWESMASDLAMLGLACKPASPDEINAICRVVHGTPIEYPANLAILRNLKRALYSPALVGHFGLGFAKYTHFTSPIRRYPDLVVHRILCALETGQQPPYSHMDMKCIAQHCSETERTAADAESESLQEQRIAYYAARLAARDLGPHKALITGVIPRGALVEMEESLQRGLIPLFALPSDRYSVDMERGCISGRNKRNQFRVGTRVEVELLRVDEARRLVDFSLISSEAPPRFDLPHKKNKKTNIAKKRRQRMR